MLLLTFLSLDAAGIGAGELPARTVERRAIGLAPGKVAGSTGLRLSVCGPRRTVTGRLIDSDGAGEASLGFSVEGLKGGAGTGSGRRFLALKKISGQRMMGG